MVGVREKDHESAWRSRYAKGLAPFSWQWFVGQENELVVAHVWRDDKPKNWSFWHGGSKLILEKMGSNLGIQDFSVVVPVEKSQPEAESRYMLVEHSSPDSTECMVIDSLSMQQQIEVSKVLLSKGYQPFTFCLSGSLKTLKSTSVWKRGIPTNVVSFTFVVFPAGQYRIGSPASERDRDATETQVSVTLTRPLAIADREICWQQFNPHDNLGRRQQWSRQYKRTLTMLDPSFGANWFDAVGYCRWLGQVLELTEEDQCYPVPEGLEKDSDGNPLNWPLRLDRRGFRLPTHAEWEIACRGGMVTSYSFGSDRKLLNRYGWFSDNSEGWSKPVGELPPDVSGLFDMHGNLMEWVHDISDEYSGKVDITDPTGPESGKGRGVRGGGFSFNAASCRSANRGGGGPTTRIPTLGFRLALSPSSQEPTEPGKGAEPAVLDTQGASAEQRPEMP